LAKHPNTGLGLRAADKQALVAFLKTLTDSQRTQKNTFGSTFLNHRKRDIEANAISVRIHGKGNLGSKPGADAIAEILLSINERRP
jgi:hypothetical protein